MFNINVLGALLTTQAAVKHLGEGSSIINIGSLVSRITLPNSVVYSGTKGALDAITGMLARELGPRKIRVNSINPGVVETEGTHKGGFIGSDLEKAAVAQTPLGRIGQVSIDVGHGKMHLQSLGMIERLAGKKDHGRAFFLGAELLSLATVRVAPTENLQAQVTIIPLGQLFWIFHSQRNPSQRRSPTNASPAVRHQAVAEPTK
jgi:NAD(P)-dependent dehydrogenase (short-subunit alcohol dehydrogenase family)